MMKVRLKVSMIVLALFTVPALAYDAPLKQPGRWAQTYTWHKADLNIVCGTNLEIIDITYASHTTSFYYRIGDKSLFKFLPFR